MHMELLLLLQELQQERAKQQLKSPLPFPTTLPLLSATLASSRTVIADPIQYLQRMSEDLLQSITAFTSPPSSSSSMQQVRQLVRVCTGYCLLLGYSPMSGKLCVAWGPVCSWSQ